MRALVHRIRPVGLGTFFGVLFLVTLIGQSFAGWAQFNDQQATAELVAIPWAEYVTSSSFATDVAENWQSEYLQFLLYIAATVWLVHRGSPESKQLDSAGRESDEDQKVGPFSTEESPAWAKVRGLKLSLFSHSLLWVMGAIFFASWAAQAVAGHISFNEQQLTDYQGPVSLIGYMLSSDFWARTLQNWQSEFLAVGSMVVFSVFLRERGSSQSKPVGAPHDTTGA